MVPEVRRRIAAKLTAYREWKDGRKLGKKARLVQYWDCLEPPKAFDVPWTEIEDQIEGLVSEGFQVDWAEHSGRVYLRVWEEPGPEPGWPEVFAEAPSCEPCDPPSE